MPEIYEDQEDEDAKNAPSTPPAPQMLHVELSKVVPNPHQPRKTFSEVSLNSLADSMKIAGVIQPIIVRQVEDHYEVIAGERRWRAAKIAGLVTIPVILRRIDSVEQSQLALIENIHREDLNPIERAIAYRELIRTTGMTHAEIATRLGEDRSTVGNHVRLLDLPEKTRNWVMEGSLSFGHAKILVGLEELDRIDALAELVVTQQLSVRNLERLIKDGIKPKLPTAAKPATPHIADLERQISRDLQMRAEVKQAKKSGKGRLVIHYASLDQFDELLTRLGIKVDD